MHRCAPAGVERHGIAVASAMFVAIALLVGATVAISAIVPSKTTPGTAISNSAGVTYSDNGLICTLPIGTPAYVSSLVPRITQTAQFNDRAGSLPYVYVYTDNITNHSVTVNNNTKELPDMVELGFYTDGPTTSCNDTGTLSAIHLILVQVPLQNGAFNLTGATYTLQPPHY